MFEYLNNYKELWQQKLKLLEKQVPGLLLLRENTRLAELLSMLQRLSVVVQLHYK